MLVARGIGWPVPDWVPILRLAERWGSPPWTVWDDAESPSRGWWRHVAGILAQADEIVADRRTQQAKQQAKR